MIWLLLVFRPPVQPVKISVTFTWDIPEAERLYRAWSAYYPDVELGGPAFGDPGGEFESGMFVKQGVTITSRGCTKECPWCFVPKREGWIRELPIHSGEDIADNNLLACSEWHIRSVFDMLKNQHRPVKFSGGLDIDMLSPWHIDLLKTIRLKYAWFACDHDGAFENLSKASDLLSDFSIEKKRCYVLIGFEGDTIKKAGKRLERVYRLGFLPMAMLYVPESKISHSSDWLSLRREWVRPAIYRSKMKASA